MTSAEREEALFRMAVPLAPGDRAVYLDRECAGDPALRGRLDALLAAHDQPDTIDAVGVVSGVPRSILDPGGLPGLAGDEDVGGILGRYKLLERLGEGGCGVVYVAEQTEPVHRRVALKLIKPGMDSKAVIARFEAERQALAMMDHPHIAKVLDAGTTAGGRPYFVMELVRGVRLTEYCDRKKLSVRGRLGLFIQVCRAIQHAHQKGIIHRDIKPSNILVTLHDGVPVPKVIDFGIAKAVEGRLTDATVYTQLHQFLGTPAYMSPEQAEMSGLDIDTRSDIYSLGVLLYELLTGVTPFDPKELLSQGLDAMRRTIREKEPPRPSTRLTQLQGSGPGERSLLPVSHLPSDLDWIVMKCLEKDRARRYETANGLAADLDRHLKHEPVMARPASAAYRFRKAWRRHRLVFAAAAAMFVGLLVAVTSLGLAMHRSRAALEAARSLAVDRVRLAIMSCDVEEAERALALAGRSGLPESKLRLLRALHLVADSQSEKAQLDLQSVRRSDSGNLVALGLYAGTTLMNSGWGAYEKLLSELTHADPRTPEEKLWIGYALVPAAHDRGVALMEQAIEEEGSPLARVLLAQARMTKAADENDLDLMRRALDDLAASSAWKPRAVRVLISAVEIHSAAARLHRHLGDGDAERHQLGLASRAIGQLEQYHPRSLRASRARLGFLIERGQIDSALELAVRAAREHPGSRFEQYTAHVLGLHGRYREAMVLARSLRSDPLMRAVHFFAAIETPDGLAEARASAAELGAGTPEELNDVFAGAALNFLLGDTNPSVRLARSYLASQGMMARMVMPSAPLSVVRYLAAETSEDELLKMSTGAEERCLALHFVGLYHLARGDRATAVAHLRRSVEDVAVESATRSISQHILKRMAADPTWPPTIPVQAPGSPNPPSD